MEPEPGADAGEAPPPAVAESLHSPIAAALRLSQLAVALRERQLGGESGSSFGGVCAEDSALCPGGTPSFELTCGAVWAWGAATRSSQYRPGSTATAEVELYEVSRDAAWCWLVEQEALRRAQAQPLSATEAAALLLAAASELLLGDSERETLAKAAVADLTAALGRPGCAAGSPPGAWLVLPLLLYAHATGREELALEGRRLAVSCTLFPELPLCWWDDTPPSGGLSPWAGALVAAIVACQGEQELTPWCARVAAASLPSALRGEASHCEAGWAHDASLIMALQALTRALPKGWTPLRRAEKAFAQVATQALQKFDTAPQRELLTARLAVAFALYGFSVEPGGPRVCC